MVSRSSPVSLAHLGDAVWRADELACAAGATVATGHPALDAQLPGGGWPVGAISEILQLHSGQNEWRLLLPALRHAAPGPVVLVGPPHVPFGPGLWAQGFEARRLLWVTESAPAARLWAAEQALRCAEVVAVLAWLPQVRAEQLRRLQIAAQEHSKLLFVLRPAQAQSESSPAVLRLLASTSPDGDALLLHILKRRGPPLEQPLSLPARPARLAVLLAGHARQADDEAQELGAWSEPALCFFPGSDDALDRTAAAA
jgi:protein ImuA